MSLNATSTTNLNPNRMALRFRGVRGSVPTPTEQNLAHGGNTACLEICIAGQSVVFDAGTGLIGLGAALKASGQVDIHLFLTHFHWDHIQGLPFFAPLYDPSTHITIYSMKPPEEAEAALAAQMKGPYFPVEFRNLPARRSFVDIRGQSFRIGGAEITSFPLNHPQGCHGYGIEYGGSKLVFASDLEYGVPALDTILHEAAATADLLVFDAHFTPEEYETHSGWGHSSWRHATQVAREAGARRVALFHHAPDHGEEQMLAILKAAQAEFPDTLLAVEGETILI